MMMTSAIYRMRIVRVLVAKKGDVANPLDPHKRKGGGIVDWDAVASRGPNRVESEVDADSDDSDRYHRREPEERRVFFPKSSYLSLLSCSFVFLSLPVI